MCCNQFQDQRYQVIVIGLGKIGLGYDLNGPETCCFTHTKAFHRHPGFELIGGVDSLPDRRREFEQFTGKPAVSVLENLSIKGNPAIIVIATPPEDRLKIVLECLTLRPALILLEKPLAINVEEGRRIVRLCREHETELCVNYIRRCDPAVLQILSDIRSNKFGAFQSGQVVYSGGVLSNASHLLDLIFFWLGPSACWDTLGPVPWSSRPGDPDLDFWLDFNGRRCVFQAVDERVFSMAQVELIFEKAAIRYEDFGRQIALHWVERDPDFPECKRLRPEPLLLPSDMGKYQWNVADHLYRHFTAGEPLVSTGETALEVLNCCETLKSK
jgi:predicted dehydrogenase